MACVCWDIPVIKPTPAQFSARFILSFEARIIANTVESSNDKTLSIRQK